MSKGNFKYYVGYSRYVAHRVPGERRDVIKAQRQAHIMSADSLESVSNAAHYLLEDVAWIQLVPDYCDEEAFCRAELTRREWIDCPEMFAVGLERDDGTRHSTACRADAMYRIKEVFGVAPAWIERVPLRIQVQHIVHHFIDQSARKHWPAERRAS